MKAAGYEWVTVNIGDGLSWASWSTVRSRAAVAGVAVIPWKRCWKVADIHDVLTTAKQAATGIAILNIEDEFKDSLEPDVVAREIRASGYPGEVGISTVGWLYNDVDYKPLAHLPALLQMFWEDMRFDPALMEQKQRDCVWHARTKGVTYVGVTFMTVRSQPSWYAYHSGTRSLYTADDVGGDWSAWAVT